MKIKQKMNKSKNTTGLIRTGFLGILLWVSLLPGAFAAQSNSYSIDADSPTYDEHAAGVSPGYQLTGGITWRQTAPLTSNSYQIVQNPPAAATTSTPTSAASVQPIPTSSLPTGGHRGSSVSSTTASLHPAASSQSSSSRAHSIRSIASEASVSSVQSTVSSALSAVSSLSQASSGGQGTASTGSECETSQNPSLQHSCQILLTSITSGTGFFSGGDMVSLFLLGFILGLLTGLLLYRVMLPRKKKETKAYRRLMRLVILLSLLLAIGSFAITYTAHAAITTPQRYVYNGHLLDNAGHPITTPHTIRFSFWKTADLGPTDITAGALDTGAATYGGWQEIDTVTPDANGYFSVQLGAVTPLPALTFFTATELQDLFLQVEVKAQPEPDTSYEVLDVNPGDSTIDRSPILSIPFAHNADLLDQREIGTGSGSIPLLGPDGKLPASAMPSALNGTSLTLDNTNTATGSISLQFGEALAKKLSYDTVNNRFNFNDAVQVEGNLTVLGLINGVDITNLGSVTDALRVGSGGGLTITITGGNYRLAGNAMNYAGGTVAVAANATNYVFFGSGGLTINTVSFPTDESFIPLAEVHTDASAVSFIVDQRQLMSDDREQLVETTLHPEYADSSYVADGVDNVGQLSVTNDPATLKNSYLWTSTRTTLQDYDVAVRITLPTQFTHWKASPLSFLYKSSSADASITKMDIAVFDTDGNAVTLTGTSTGLANTAWTTQTLDFAGSPVWTPGGTVVVRFKLSAKDNEQMMLGDFGLKYTKMSGN